MSSPVDVERWPQPHLLSISEEKPTAANRITEIVSVPPQSPQSKRQTTRQKNGHTLEDAHNRGWRYWIVELSRFAYNFRVLFCWVGGAVTLAIALALTGTVFHTAHIKNVRLFGFFFWLAMSWCGLLVSYITSWTLGYVWFVICQNDWPIPDDYETFLVDTRHSMMLFLWAITSWALVPVLCLLDHHHCTDHWVSVLHKALLVTFIFVLVLLVRSFLLEQLFIKTAIEHMNWRQDPSEKSFQAVTMLLPVADRRPSIYERITTLNEWTKAMRTWSKPVRTKAKNLEQDNSESPENLEQDNSESLVSKSMAQYLADIFQGNGSEAAYAALRDKIKSNQDLRPFTFDHNQHPDGLHESQVKAYLGSQEQLSWFQPNKNLKLTLGEFDDFDDFWRTLKDWPSSEDRDRDSESEFVTFDNLSWQLRYWGECLKKAVKGQKELKMVVNSLNTRVTIVLLIPIAIICAAIFTKNFITNFTPLWTAFFGISFAVQDPVKEFVSACVFVFAQHPYDLGDLVVLEGEKDHKLVVRDIYLMHSTFEPVGGGKEIHIPHCKLATECIENLSRRPQSLWPVVLQLDKKPPSDILKELNKEVTATFQLPDYQARRFYDIQELTLVPIKEEESVEKGILVEFRVKRVVPEYYYKENKKFRTEVLQHIRRRLQEQLAADVPGTPS